MVESRVVAHFEGHRVSKFDVSLYLELVMKCHASLSRPDLVLVTRSISSYYSYSIQVFSGMVSRRDMVQVPLEPSLSRDARKFYKPEKFAIANSQCAKIFAKTRISGISPRLCIVERRAIAYFKGLVDCNFSISLYLTLTFTMTLRI